ncbi:EfeM/EfeO family lipoprotein [Deinococcus sp. KNUC1210]|uniref:imelysin family protein n=1 Tax=Deinococcus sp. KNUC1210 TaxID=2917691 RepID=UPI001EF05AAE|nr:imelysin family protein [Deinococcus sp. KNUC1210]ULH14988.1 EfeM/EfeO family lipoprotein [Deinococcus sp. KNUC1210]
MQGTKTVVARRVGPDAQQVSGGRLPAGCPAATALTVWALLSACSGVQAAEVPATLKTVQTYLTQRLTVQAAGTAQLVRGADAYYALARAAGFDYRKLSANTAAVQAALKEARDGWTKASPVYEEIEGIVAGVNSLSAYDVILDAGTSAAEGGDAVALYDLKLPSGHVLSRPGNLFGVNEGTLWNTVTSFSSGVAFDVDGDGKLGFGDRLPDANVLKAAAAELNRQTGLLRKAAATWQPTRADVFGALLGNVPTVGPVFFENWKTSRFVLGNATTRRDFVVISRLSDLSGNVASWEAMYRGLSAEVKAKNPQLDTQIRAGLSGLNSYVLRLATLEKRRHFTPEQADSLQAEAQNRATAITGRITQAAALLGVKVSE